jgi:hypothetical protein
MRKKKQADTSDTSPTEAPIKKTIVKAHRVVRDSAAKKPSRNLTAMHVEPNPTNRVDVVEYTEGGGSLSGSNKDSGTERSPTPLENDLLQYLTLHIAPPPPCSTENGYLQPDNSWLMTSFDIGVNEYLQGIVRLIQSDCPEAVQDIKPFMAAMRKAFVEVKTPDILPP